MKISIKFEPRDFWIGVFWNYKEYWASGVGFTFDALEVALSIPEAGR